MKSKLLCISLFIVLSFTAYSYSAVNLLSNPGFEDALWNTWYTTGSSGVAQEGWAARNGSYGAGFHGWESYIGGCFNEANGESGKTYEFSIYGYKEPGFTASSVFIKIEFIGPGPAWTTLKVTDEYNIYNISSDTWIKFSIRGVSPPNTAMVRAVLGCANPTAGGAYRFDDAELIEITNGTKWHVSQNSGDDSNNGTDTYPYKTLHKVLPLLNTGDTLIIKDNAEYEIGFDTRLRIDTQDITITSDNGPVFKAVGSWGSDSPVIDLLSNADSFTVNGIIIDCNSAAPAGIRPYTEIANLKITNNTIKKFTSYGILSQSKYAVISGNTIKDCTSGAGIKTDYGATGDFDSLYIYNNIITGITNGHAILLYRGSNINIDSNYINITTSIAIEINGNNNGCTISNNIINCGDKAVKIEWADNTVIDNNVITNSNKTALYFANDADSTVIRNNVITNSNWYSIEIDNCDNVIVDSNTCSSIDGIGITVANGSLNTRIRYNYLKSCKSDAIKISGSTTTGWSIERNLCYEGGAGSSGSGIALADNTNGTVVFNTSYGNKGAGLWTNASDFSNFVCKNNIFYNNGWFDVHSDNAYTMNYCIAGTLDNVTRGTNCLDKNPAFIQESDSTDLTTYLHLSDTSPAISSGDPADSNPEHSDSTYWFTTMGRWPKSDVIAPPPVNLVSPANTSSTTVVQLSFFWKQVNDTVTGVEASGIFKYKIEFDTNSNWNDVEYYELTSDTSLTLNLTEGTYNWRVLAVDNAGNTNTYGADTWSFQITAVVETYNGPVWYVSKISGSDSNNGDSTTPYKTIQKALYRCSNGDTVKIIDSETYTVSNNNEYLLIDTPGITLISDSKAAIQATGAVDALIINTVNYGADSLYIKGLILDCNSKAVYAVILNGQINNLNLIDCVITGYTYSGIYANVAYGTIENCRFHNSSGSGGAVLVKWNAGIKNLTIYNNEFYNITGGYCLSIDTSANITVDSNYFHDNSVNAVYCYGMDSSYITNNLIAGAPDKASIFFDGGSDSIYVYNNRLTAGGEWGTIWGTKSRKIIIDSNTITATNGGGRQAGILLENNVAEGLIKNNYITPSDPDIGIRLNNSVTNCYIISNRITGGTTGILIEQYSSANTAESNIISSTGRSGIRIDTESNNCSIDSNIISGFGKPGIYIHFSETSVIEYNECHTGRSDGIKIEGSYGWTVNRSLIHSQPDQTGIAVVDNSSNGTVTFTTVYGCNTAYWTNCFTGITVKNSIFYASENTDFFGADGTLTVNYSIIGTSEKGLNRGIYCLDLDPQFIQTMDSGLKTTFLHLNDSSPAIAHGNPEDADNENPAPALRTAVIGRWPASVTQNTNLLVNSGFETASGVNTYPQYWSLFGDMAYISRNGWAAKDGSYGFGLHSWETGKSGGCYQDISGIGDTYYIFSVYVQKETNFNADSVWLKLEWFTSAGTAISTSDKNIITDLSTSWLKFSVQDTSPSNTGKVRVTIHGENFNPLESANAAIKFDNTSLIIGASSAEPPEITSIYPENNASNIDTTVSISVTFSTGIDSTSVEQAFYLSDGNETYTSDSGVWTWTTVSGTFTLTFNLNYSAVYYITIDTSVRASGTLENMNSVYTSKFTTSVSFYGGPLWYVSSKTGSDMNNGSLTSPFATIQKALYKTSTGDTVKVIDSETYTISSSLIIDTPNITLIAEADSFPSIKADSEIEALITNTVSYKGDSLVIDGFKLDCNSTAVYAVKLEGQINNLQLKNSVITGYTYSGVYANAAYGTIENCRFHNSPGSGGAVLIKWNIGIKNLKIYNNEFYSITGGVCLSIDTSSNITVDSNYFHDNTVKAVSCYGMTNSFITNNLISGVKGKPGIYFESGCDSLYIYNNRLVSGGEWGSIWGKNSRGTIIDSNAITATNGDGGYAGILVEISASQVQIKNNYITPSGGDIGIRLNNYTIGCTIAFNDITGGSYGIKISSHSSNNVVYSNIIKSTFESAIKVDTGSNNCSIDSNIISGYGNAGIYIYASETAVISYNECHTGNADGIKIEGSYGWIIDHNLIHSQSSRTGIAVVNNAADGIVKFTTIYGCNTAYWTNCLTGIIIKDSIFYGNTLDFYSDGDSAPADYSIIGTAVNLDRGNYCLDLDPQFVQVSDSSVKNTFLHLNDSSPAISHGNPEDADTVNLNPALRISTMGRFPAEISQGINLLLNEGFETASNIDTYPLYWSLFGDMAYISRNGWAAKDGSYGFGFHSWETGKSGGCYQDISGIGDTFYAFSVYVLKETNFNADSVWLKLEWFTSTGTAISTIKENILTSLSTSWSKFTVQDTSPPNTGKIRVTIHGENFNPSEGTNAAIKFDNTSLSVGKYISDVPSVISVAPADNSIENDTVIKIKVTFSKEIDSNSVENAFYLSDASSTYTSSEGEWTWDLTSGTFTSAVLSLSYNKTYYITIDTGVKDTESPANNMTSVFTSMFKTKTSYYSGPVWYVSRKVGADTNNGSSTSPFYNISAALSKCSNGDTVKVIDSETYTISSSLIIDTPNITLISDSSPVITADTEIEALIKNSINYLADSMYIEGFILDCNSKSDYAVKLDGQVNNFHLKNCIITDYSYSGVYPNAAYGIIEDCRFHHASGNGAGIIVKWNSDIKNLKIYNNEFYSITDGSAVSIDTSSNMLIDSNYFHDNTVISIYGYGMNSSYITGNLISGHTGKAGIYFESGCDSLLIYNNKLTAGGSWGSIWGKSSTDILIDSNSITASNGGSGYACILLENKISNSTVKNNYFTPSGRDISIRLNDNVTNTTIKYNDITGGSQGIIIESNSSNNTIDSNIIKSTLSNAVKLTDNADNCRIDSNIIYRYSGEGIYVYNSADAAISYNECYSGNNDGIKIEKSSGWSILRTLIHSQSSFTGIAVINESSNGTVNFTTVYGCNFGYWTNCFDNISIKNSIFYGNSESDFVGDGDTLTVNYCIIGKGYGYKAGINVYNTDPVFIQVSDSSVKSTFLHPDETSPAIGNGDPADADSSNPLYRVTTMGRWPVSVSEAGINLLINSGFELGQGYDKITNWSRYGENIGREDWAYRTGSYGLGFHGWVNGGGGGVYQDISGAENVEYEFSVYVYRETNFNAEHVKLKIEWYNSDDSGLGLVDTNILTSLTANSWILTSLKGTSPDNTSKVRVVIEGANYSPPEGAGSALGFKADDAELVRTKSVTEGEAPLITAVFPTDNSFGQEPDMKISLTFSKTIDTSSVEDAFYFTNSNDTYTSDSGTWKWNNNSGTFTPSFLLGLGETYSMYAGTEVRDIELPPNYMSSIFSSTFAIRPSIILNSRYIKISDSFDTEYDTVIRSVINSGTAMVINLNNADTVNLKVTDENSENTWTIFIDMKNKGGLLKISDTRPTASTSRLSAADFQRGETSIFHIEVYDSTEINISDSQGLFDVELGFDFTGRDTEYAEIFWVNPANNTWYEVTYNHTVYGRKAASSKYNYSGKTISIKVKGLSVFGAFVLSEDSIVPDSVTDLTAMSGPYYGQVTLAWTATGDDGSKGTAKKYLFKQAFFKITSSNWDLASNISNPPAPEESGSTQTLVVKNLSAGVKYYFAVKVVDEKDNVSAISNSDSATGSSHYPIVQIASTYNYTFDNYIDASHGIWPDKSVMEPGVREITASLENNINVTYGGYATSLKLEYSAKTEEVGWWESLGGNDFSNVRSLIINVRGENTADTDKDYFLLGLKNSNNVEIKIPVYHYLDLPLSDTWQEVLIPFKAFTSIGDTGFQSMDNFSITVKKDKFFNSDWTGAFYFDDLKFSYTYGKVIVHRFPLQDDLTSALNSELGYWGVNTSITVDNIEPAYEGEYSCKLTTVTDSCGFYIICNNLDIVGLNKLVFAVKGMVGGENLLVGIKSKYKNAESVQEIKANIRKYLANGITDGWQKVEVPLIDFFTIDLNKIEDISFTLAEPGTVRIDDIYFINDTAAAVPQDFQVNDNSGILQSVNELSVEGPSMLTEGPLLEGIKFEYSLDQKIWRTAAEFYDAWQHNVYLHETTYSVFWNITDFPQNTNIYLRVYSYNTSGIYTILYYPNNPINTLAVDRSVIVYPNPFFPKKGTGQLTFTNFPPGSVVKIYTISGELVKTIYDEYKTGRISWDGTNKGGEKVASGIYLYLIMNEGNKVESGKFIVIK